MLHVLSETIGMPVRASDGEVGTVQDFFVRADDWRIEYVVVDAGRWLPGREVLIHANALMEPEHGFFRVGMAKEQVRNLPQQSTKALQSCDRLIGYRIVVEDGQAEVVEDFILSHRDWSIPYFVSYATGPFQNDKVILATKWIESINPDRKAIYVDLSKEELCYGIKLSNTQLEDRCERKLAENYGIPIQLDDDNEPAAAA